MRHRILLWLAMGWLTGSACSARSLLVITVTASEPGVGGSPRVVVTRQGQTTPVRSIDERGSVILLLGEDDDPTAPPHAELGLYLPADVEGVVQVAVTLVPDGSCKRWVGAPRAATVHPGRTTAVSIAVEASLTECSSVTSDAGVDMAPPGPPAEAGADVACPDVGSPAVEAGPTCQGYCQAYVGYCADFGAGTEGDCLAACASAAWPPGDPLEPTNADTLGCRLRIAKSAANPALRAVNCPAASPAQSVCAPAPDASIF
jgi:hypothetical protein